MIETMRTAQRMRRMVVMLLPFCLGFSWMTLVIGPAYPRYEYAKPDFPPDWAAMEPNSGLVPFTPTERLALALPTVAYLESWQPADEAIRSLAEQRQPHTGAPLYNERELRHLMDVKHLTDRVRWLALLTAVPVSSGLLFLLKRPHTRRLGYLALGQGGLLTVMLLSGLAALILFGWPIFFYQFHGLLFASGSWSFAPTDSLMRLYPERFFFDVGVIMSVCAWLWGFMAAVIGYRLAWRAKMPDTAIRGLHVQEVVG